MNCPICKSEVPENSLYCPECGAKVQNEAQQTGIGQNELNNNGTGEQYQSNQTYGAEQPYQQNQSYNQYDNQSNNQSYDGGNYAPQYAEPAPMYGNGYQENPVENENCGDSSKDGYAVSSLIISIMSLIGIGNICTAIVSLILGIVGVKSRKKGLSVAGIIISAISIVLSILLIIALFGLAADFIEEAYNRMEDNGTSVNDAEDFDDFFDMFGNDGIFNQYGIYGDNGGDYDGYGNYDDYGNNDGYGNYDDYGNNDGYGNGNNYGQFGFGY